MDDYDKWEPLFCEDEDILKQIQKKTFVPFTIFEDGTRTFSVRIDDKLTEKEDKYKIVHSEKYLFQTQGKAILSGIEYIDKKVEEKESIILDLQPGTYEVEVYLLAWDEDPQAFLPNGQISPKALSDFVVLVHSKTDPNKKYRERVNTFSEDD
ncbi:MAG: hypothetical protein KBT48_06380 [Firmicutes bacterium]|nr:hypothetical protein [Bacillota bacterium]